LIHGADLGALICGAEVPSTWAHPFLHSPRPHSTQSAAAAPVPPPDVLPGRRPRSRPSPACPGRRPRTLWLGAP
jgi:hypothetical protein